MPLRTSSGRGRRGASNRWRVAEGHDGSIDGWAGADEWARRASDIAPTLVGGSRKHGGPDFGPTRAKQAWRKLPRRQDMGLADESSQGRGPGRSDAEADGPDGGCDPGFPAERWKIFGRKTASYRQVGNAFPPPVAEAVGKSFRDAILAARAHGKAIQTEGVTAAPARHHPRAADFSRLARRLPRQ